jgi:hypothetical protein
VQELPEHYGSLDRALVFVVAQNARFCVLCLGRDTLPINGTLNTVFNVVVRSPDLAVSQY